MPAIGDIYQYTFMQLCQGLTFETVIHMRAVVAAPTDAQLKLSADNWLATMFSLQTNRVTYPQVVIKRMTPIPFDEILYVPTAIVAGQYNEGEMNSTVSLIFTKRTGVAGTSHRGRMYIGGFPASWGTNRLTSGAGIAAVGAAAGNFLAKFQEGGTDGSVVAGVYSKSIGGIAPMTLAGWQPITRWDPQLIFGNQRRRREGVGI